MLDDYESELESNHDESDIDIDVEAVKKNTSDTAFIEKSELDVAEADKQNKFKVDFLKCLSTNLINYYYYKKVLCR